MTTWTNQLYFGDISGKAKRIIVQVKSGHVNGA